jgi:hypothetical protein
MDDVHIFICADIDAWAGAEFSTQKRFCCIPGSCGEPEEYSDEYTGLVSSKICHFHFSYNRKH